MNKTEDATQIAWGTGLVDELNRFLARVRIDGREVESVTILNGTHLAITTTARQSPPDAGLDYYDRPRRNRDDETPV
jgi:hypothetical protein